MHRKRRILKVLLAALAATTDIRCKSCVAFQTKSVHDRERELFRVPLYLSSDHEENPNNERLSQSTKSISKNRICRREMLISLATGVALLPSIAQAAPNSIASPYTLEDLELGEGRWETLGRSGRSRINSEAMLVPASYATYMARFLINYDEGVNTWWGEMEDSFSLLSEEQGNAKLGRAFGSFAASIQLAINSFVKEKSSLRDGYSALSRILLEKYSNGNGADEVKRHICLLCAILPKDQQPTQFLRQVLKSIPDGMLFELSKDPPPSSFSDDFTSLLPENFGCVPLEDGSFFGIRPQINLYEVGVDEEFGQAATATPFGPLSSNALIRDFPAYSRNIYALFGISGATGCALTHSIVIPLDVVKTKAQTDPDEYANIFSGASKIVTEEGVQGLLTGAQATLAGYFWYGLSVYPSYTFFKRYMGQSLLPADFAIAHANDIALIAGALAAVIASLGLTPLEAARIRVVADPERYRPLGLFGTLGVISKEDASLGWKAVYAGLPSLMTRQVIFGSVKFLAFERACETIYAVWPVLRDATWTALTVSLVAGGFSGALSSVVSQPADAVLTYVAQKNDGRRNLGVLEGCQLMVEESGVESLFRGLGSRCLWAGSIIAGQFLLYDVFRNYFGVNVEDLSQVFHVEI